MELTESTRLEARTYFLPEGIRITADGVELDGGGATIVGAGRSGPGIRVDGREGVAIRDLNLVEFEYGVQASLCQGLSLHRLRVSSTKETPPNSDFLNIFHQPGEYPGAIRLERTENTRVEDCELSHQMSGVLSYGCRSLLVTSTRANYNSAFGFYLSGTTESVFSGNYADFCCRWHARDGGGHMGADAAGFVLVNGASRNRFTDNFARLGGDGFFLAGLGHDGTFAPCNENEFLRNDASWSPNIAFEATFSARNVFQGNRAEQCNYGFWLGFSRENRLDGNVIQHNRQAGIAVENGIEMRVRDNEIAGNTFGMLLWSKRIPQFDHAVPENDTSRDWLIESNRFRGNAHAIRIAADQDHGLRPFFEHGTCPPPRGHRLAGNLFERNRVDVDAEPAYLI